MSGVCEDSKKIPIKVNAFIHLPDKYCHTPHIDFEFDGLNEIIKPREQTLLIGKSGGVFVCLKKEMIERLKGCVEKMSEEEENITEEEEVEE